MIKRVIKGHPLMIFSYMYPYLFVLILPLMRSGIQYLRYGEINGLVLWEAIVLSVLFALALLKWRRFSVTVSSDAVTINSGILLKRSAVVPKSCVSCVCAETDPVTWLFRCATVSVNTEAGRMGRADFSFKLYAKDMVEAGLMPPKKRAAATVRSSFGELLLMAASSSSALSGLIIAVPLVNKSARLLGNSIIDALMKTVTDAEKLFEGVVPPVVNAVTLVFIACYLVAFVIAFCHYFGFQVRYTGDGLEIRSGLLRKYRTKFRRNAVNNVCVEQNFIFRLLSRYSLRISVGGYGERRGEMAVIVPAGRYSDATALLCELYPDFGLAENAVRPPEGSRYRFYFLPCLWLVGLPAAATLLCGLFPVFAPFISFFFCALCAVPLYFLSLGEHNYKKAEVVFGDMVFARSTAGARTKELICQREKIGVVTIRRFPADMAADTCNLRLVIRSEGADSISVKHLSYSRLKRALAVWTDGK